MDSFALREPQQESQGVAALDLGSWLEFLAQKELAVEAHPTQHPKEALELAQIVSWVSEHLIVPAPE